MGECFFWYRPTRVVPDKGPLNGCTCMLLSYNSAVDSQDSRTQPETKHRFLSCTRSSLRLLLKPKRVHRSLARCQLSLRTKILNESHGVSTYLLDCFAGICGIYPVHGRTARLSRPE